MTKYLQFCLRSFCFIIADKLIPGIWQTIYPPRSDEEAASLHDPESCFWFSPSKGTITLFRKKAFCSKTFSTLVHWEREKVLGWPETRFGFKNLSLVCVAGAGYFVWLVFIACTRGIRSSSHLLSIFFLLRARVLETSPLALKKPGACYGRQPLVHSSKDS